MFSRLYRIVPPPSHQCPSLQSQRADCRVWSLVPSYGPRRVERRLLNGVAQLFQIPDLPNKANLRYNKTIGPNLGQVILVLVLVGLD